MEDVLVVKNRKHETIVMYSLEEITSISVFKGESLIDDEGADADTSKEYFRISFRDGHTSTFDIYAHYIFFSHYEDFEEEFFCEK
jgi:hypothetical protein